MYKEHTINQSKNFISGWYIDKSLCNRIIEKSESKKILYKDIDNNYKNYVSKNLSDVDIELQEEYIHHLLNLYESYKNQYPYLNEIMNSKIFSFDNGTPAIQLQRYSPGRYYSKLHCENPGVVFLDRNLAFMTYLNDIEDGGGTSFPYQDFESKAECGLTLIWPAYWTHPHMGVKTDSTKFILTGWFVFEKYKKTTSLPFLQQ